MDYHAVGTQRALSQLGLAKHASTKVAVTRTVKEIRKALRGGDIAGAEELASAYKKLQVPARHVQDIGAGMEGATELVAGKLPLREQSPTGLAVKKLYYPTGPLSQGTYTKQLLEEKKKTTDRMRRLSPRAEEFVARMYGHKQTGNPAWPKNTSYHEWVPPATGSPYSIRREQMLERDLNAINRHVLHPMAARRQTSVFDVDNNPGNLMYDPRTKQNKIIDFLPVSHAKSGLEFDSAGALVSFNQARHKKLVGKQKSPIKFPQGAPDEGGFLTATPPRTPAQLRKDVYNP